MGFCEIPKSEPRGAFGSCLVHHAPGLIRNAPGEPKCLGDLIASDIAHDCKGALHVLGSTFKRQNSSPVPVQLCSNLGNPERLACNRTRLLERVPQLAKA